MSVECDSSNVLLYGAELCLDQNKIDKANWSPY